MAHYQITQTETAQSLGVYEADSAEAAIRAMLADAGSPDATPDAGLVATELATTYAIRHSHGQTETGFATYEAACEAVRAVYRSAAIGHSGDISDGGERTLCWVDEDTARDDDGSRACCKIVARHGA